MIRSFLLPLADRERLREAGGPLAEVDLTQLEFEAIPVVEIDGQIVAYWPCFFGLHLEPLWVIPTARGNPAVAAGLLSQIGLALQQIDRPVAFAVIDPDTPPALLAERLGFARVPGDLYYVMRPAPAPVEG